MKAFSLHSPKKGRRQKPRIAQEDCDQTVEDSSFLDSPRSTSRSEPLPPISSPKITSPNTAPEAPSTPTTPNISSPRTRARSGLMRLPGARNVVTPVKFLKRLQEAIDTLKEQERQVHANISAQLSKAKARLDGNNSHGAVLSMRQVRKLRLQQAKFITAVDDLQSLQQQVEALLWESWKHNQSAVEQGDWVRTKQLIKQQPQQQEKCSDTSSSLTNNNHASAPTLSELELQMETILATCASKHSSSITTNNNNIPSHHSPKKVLPRQKQRVLNAHQKTTRHSSLSSSLQDDELLFELFSTSSVGWQRF